ncbi:low temperature requirement protein A [Secundilactobacillus paracollinoides]|uniref:low temperature requirement protein A n=1 Tax=Secundilactobacillus paracollinoides TaxID=240427 RepID=UPI00081A3F64|nr:low temperature requirement protein A [Secundilactobacillus paracollinoides]ANZ63563.1 low temperature requirement protein A [Secundilactobacillus paracollinoides]
MEVPTDKRVSMFELFYDLVFAYMIAQATDLIHHLHHGVLSPITLLIFVFVIIVFINSWMVQSVFTNRYGRSFWIDIGFTFIDMMIVLYMSNSFAATLNTDLHPFFIAAGLLSLTLLLQYGIVLFRTQEQIDRRIAADFVGILLIRTVTLLSAGYLPLRTGLPLAIIGILISWTAPAFTGRQTKQHPIIFSHLLERLTLLTIITFGETIVSIATFFTRDALSWTSVLIFIIVASLFFIYIVQFDHLIASSRSGETGNLLIYLHYPIIFGLSLVTVSLHFIADAEANLNFAVTALYAGIGLLLFGVWSAKRYNQHRFRIHNHMGIWFVVTTVIGYVGCLWRNSFQDVVLMTTIVTVAACAYTVYYRFKAQNNQK